MKCLVCNRNTKLFMADLFDDRYGAPGRYDIYRCGWCGFGRISPGLSPKEIGSFYARYYPLAKLTPQAVKRSVSLLPAWRSWLAGTDNIAHHYTKPGMQVLDIGSASGVSLLEIKKLGGTAFGVEPDPTAAKLARRLKLRVFTGFITDHPFAGHTFDLITASQVIEHTPDPQAFLLAVAKRLNKGGHAILSFPNFDAFYRRLFGRRWLHWHIPYHYNFFTPRSFETLAAQAGLAVVKQRTITPNLWTMIQLRMLIDPPAEGKMGSVWAAQHSRAKSYQSTAVFTRLMRQGAFVIGSGVSAVANRIVDGFGHGESLVVWLKQRES